MDVLKCAAMGYGEQYICSDEFWDDHNARVLCKQLGFSEYGKIHYGLPPPPVLCVVP